MRSKPEWYLSQYDLALRDSPHEAVISAAASRAV
jgi:hypothetical protein